MDPLKSNEIPGNVESTNPYATPIDIGADSEVRQVLAMSRASTAPWTGGWVLAILIVMGMTGLVMAGALGLGSFTPLTGIFGVPILALAAIAMIVRVLHAKVMIDWVTYGLASVGFGAAAFVCFIPVCVVVTIPTMALVDTLRTPALSGFTIGGAIFLSISICGLLFVGLLRLYFNSKYRSQVFQEAMLSQSYTATSFENGVDPWTIHSTAPARTTDQSPSASGPSRPDEAASPEGRETEAKPRKSDPTDET